MSKKLTSDVMAEIERKALAGEQLSNPTAEKQYYYDSFKNQGNQGNKPTWDASQYENAKPPSYQSQYGNQMNDLMNQIMSKPDFNYDMNSDPLYQQYKEQYNREGNRAMQDAMSEASNLTGGRMNSWAMTAGSQAQDYYNQKLNDKVPELQQLAYSMYNDKYNQMANQLSMLQGMDQMDYQRYQDTYNRWNDDRNFGYNQYRDTVGDWSNDRNFNYQTSLDKYNIGYQGERDTIADERYNTEWQNQLAQQALAESQWNKTFDRNVFESDRGYNRGVYESDRSYAASQAKAKASASKSSSSKSSSAKSPYTNAQLNSQVSKMMNATDEYGDPLYSNSDIIDWVLTNSGNDSQAMQVLNYNNVKEDKPKTTSSSKKPTSNKPQFIDPKTTASFFRK